MSPLVSLRLPRVLAACVVSLCLAPPAMADPTLGFGISVSFGAGRVDTGIGVRVFPNNRRQTTSGSLGLDYMLGSRTWRGTVGVVRLGGQGYLGLDLGIGLSNGAISFGVSGGRASLTAGPVTTGAPAPAGGASSPSSPSLPLNPPPPPLPPAPLNPIPPPPP